MVKLTKEDENKLGQILKGLKEVGEMLKGGEGSGKKGHRSASDKEAIEMDEKIDRLKRKAKIIPANEWVGTPK